MENLKTYIVFIGALILLFLGISLADKCNHTKVHKGKEVVISDIRDTNYVVVHKVDTIWKEITKVKVIYKDTKLLGDTGLTDYTNVEEDSLVKIISYSRVKGKLALQQLDYHIKFPIIKDRKDSIVTIKETITKLRVDTLKIKQSILNIGAMLAYSPINNKADLGPSVLLNFNKVKVGYTYGVISKMHQGTIYFPIKFK